MFTCRVFISGRKRTQLTYFDEYIITKCSRIFYFIIIMKQSEAADDFTNISEEEEDEIHIIHQPK